ncbi:MAG TPA: 3-hydroxyacyl-CoA dehydrogenase family protein, partial [Rhodothermales bacterium]
MEAHTPVLTQSVTSPYSSSHLPLRSVAVLGAGTMGSQIAAHAANAGLQVLLLDLPGQGADRNEIVRSGLARAVKLRPDPFFDEAARQRVRVGNFEDDLKQIADADWIIEAVVERADVKRPLLERIASVASDDAIVSTNTSGIPVAELAEGLPASFRRRLLGTHFFNPPRYLRLLEVIPTPDTDPEVVARVARFARLHLGKGIVIANDRPYFIANRIGVYAMLRAMRFFLDGEYTIEEIDAVTGTLIGRPSSATFRTADVVGLDVLMDVLTGMGERLTSDESRDQFQPPPLLQGLVGAGAKGAKVGAGFYRKEDGVIKSIARDGSGYEAHAVDAGFLSEFESIRDLDQRMVALYESDSRAGRLFRESTLDVLAYAARRVPEVTPNPADLDRALRWGFGWEKGPFEIWETLGFDRVRSDMERAGIAVPEWVARARDGIYRRRGEHTAVFIP